MCFSVHKIHFFNERSNKIYVLNSSPGNKIDRGVQMVIKEVLPDQSFVLTFTIRSLILKQRCKLICNSCKQKMGNRK